MGKRMEVKKMNAESEEDLQNDGKNKRVKARIIK